MNNNKRIVIKVGSRLIADERRMLNQGFISQLAQDIARLRSERYEVVVVSSGAVSSGRSILQAEQFSVSAPQGRERLVEEQVLASIGQPNLIAAYQKELTPHRLFPAQILVTRADFADRERYLSLRTVTENLLRLGAIPIVNENDVLSTEELDFSDNDQLSCMMAAMLSAEILIVLTDVPGIFDKPPDTPGASLLSEITDIDALKTTIGAATSSVGKGGMRSKVATADLITTLGIPMRVANGYDKDIVTRIVLGGEPLGTFFPPQGKRLSRRKAWIGAGAAPKGKIVVSTYLADLLRNRRVSSILWRGVEAVKGDFAKNDVVSILDDDGVELGRGVVRNSSAELAVRIQERKSAHEESVRTAGGNKIVVHYDNFVFS